MVPESIQTTILSQPTWQEENCYAGCLFCGRKVWTNVAGHVKHISSSPAGWGGIQDGFGDNHQNIDVLELGANVIPYIN